MNTCPNCGKMAGLHGSILQGCMCQYSMQAPPQRTWVSLTDQDINGFVEQLCDDDHMTLRSMMRAIDAKLKERNT